MTGASAHPLPLVAGSLPRLSPGEVRAANLRARRRAPALLPSALGDVAVTAAGEGPLGWEGAFAHCGLVVAGRAAEAWLPFDVVDAALRGAHPDLDVSRLGPRERALAIEALESDLFARLSGRMSEVTLVSIGRVDEPPAPAPDLLRFAVALPEATPLPVLLRCHPVERERIRRALERLPILREPIPGLVLPVAFRCAHTTISLGDFATITVGSGLLLDDTTLGFQKIVAVTAERFVQACTWQTIKPVLDGPLLKHAGANARGYIASADVSDKSDPSGGATASLDEVPIHLVFELGRTEVSVADIESLTAGWVFDLNKPLGQSVDILANGRRIGAGELVRIGDSIGVRVSRLVR
ncbi:type III secretion system cytoplasmic ring protein SctQ [Salinarimonas chemoclinalis]|uniref:type III secretion system cytoplasmic ring protein SctQ n=1 Tax=Salinarimonas chemoclinalis TaxID=3241599 RepID=UPI00355897CA